MLERAVMSGEEMMRNLETGIWVLNRRIEQLSEKDKHKNSGRPVGSKQL